MTRTRRRLTVLVFSAAMLAAAAPAPAAPPANADIAAVVTVALGVAVPTLDPGIPAGTPAATVRRHIYEGLVSMTEDGKIVPELATEWTVSKDGLTWTFRLRKGVSFHDGTPFDAAAMKASLDRILDPKEALPNRRYLEAIDRVEAPDPQTVRIVLKEPFGAFLQHLAYDQGFAVSPAALAKHGKDIAKNPVGTGPYRFDSQVPGQSITLTRFPQYRGGQPALAKLIFTTVSEDATRVAQLESGQASVIVNVPPREAVRLGSRKDLAILSKEGNRVAHIGINVTKKPFDDKRVRQALNFAVTKRGVVTGILSGYGAEAQSIVAPSTWGYRPVPIYRYDVGRAKQLLAEAGYPKGFETTIRTPQGRYLLDRETVVAVQSMLSAVGITAKVEVVEWARYLALLRKPLAENDNALYFLGWESVTGEVGYVARTVFASRQWPPAGWNTMFYKNPRVDELIAEGDRTIAPDKRLKIYGELQQIVMEDAPWIPLFTYAQVVGTRKTVKGVVMLPFEAIDLRRAWVEKS